MATKNTKNAAKVNEAKAVEAKAKAPKAKALSQLAAAAVVLKKAKGKAMNVKQLTEAMAVQGLWTTPGGKTPHATLSAALQKEIKSKGKESRFAKVAPGQYGLSK
jgi:hypothetical protein